MQDIVSKLYDLVIIGSGTAAQVASGRVRAAGWSVAVIDDQPYGGTCALRGCDPKRMLISGAEALDAVSRMRGHGVEGQPRINWRELDQLLGAHLVGPHAEEVINLIALAIRHELTTKDLKTTMFAYPTSASDIGYML